RYATSSEDNTDGWNLTPGPAGKVVVLPVAISIFNNLSSPLPSPKRKSQVSCADMQYATMLLLSGVHLGLPQKSPCCEIRFRPEPSGRIRSMSTTWSRSQRTLASRKLLSRSEENAIHC